MFKTRPHTKLIAAETQKSPKAKTEPISVSHICTCQLVMTHKNPHGTPPKLPSGILLNLGVIPRLSESITLPVLMFLHPDCDTKSPYVFTSMCYRLSLAKKIWCNTDTPRQIIIKNMHGDTATFEHIKNTKKTAPMERKHNLITASLIDVY